MKKVVDIKFIEIDEARALKAEHMGIRFDENEYKMGDDLENSHNWVDGDWTDEELDGTCAVDITEAWSYDSLDELKETAIKRLNKNGGWYSGDAYLIAGYSSEIGEDGCEKIIRGAEVIGIIEIVRG